MVVALAYRLTDQREMIDADRARWAAVQGHDGRLRRLMRMPEYRNLFYYRLSRGNTRGRICGALLRRLWPGERTLFLNTESIGPGLFIQHGFATIVSAREIGANCWINQQVTLGFKASDDGRLEAPVLADGVVISAGAKVLGGVHIGVDSTVGANAVVVKDVPDNCTAIGVPAVVRPRGRHARPGG